MEENNKNLEEFFKRSLERFDDSPSDHVWSELKDRLDAEAGIFDQMLVWLRSALPILIPILLLIGHVFYSSHQISALETKNSTLLNENKQLLGINKDCQLMEDNYKAQLITLQENIDQLSDQNSAIMLNNKTLLSDISSLESDISNIQSLGSLSANASPARKEIGQTEWAFAEAIKNQERTILEENEVIIKDIEDENEMAKSVSVASVLDNKWSATPLKTSAFERSKKLNYHFVPLTIDDITDKKEPKYGWGPSFRIYNTIVQDGLHVNRSSSVGFYHEWRLSDRWAITNSYMFNDQKYEVEAKDDGTLEPASLDRYPADFSGSENIDRVKATSKYFDAQLGIKYKLFDLTKKSSVFVNPSAVWLLYLPQEFTFSVQQADNISVSRKKYYAYFGSANVAVGIEKFTKTNVALQVSLWAEQSFIPLGVDRQYVSMAGIRTNILF